MARSKKRQLPFVVEPRLAPIIETVGTEESGQIEIERRGYLTVSEKALLQAVTVDDDSVSQLYSLAGVIAKEQGKDTKEVFNDITSQSTDDYLEEYRERISRGLMALISFQERRSMVTATALLISRVDSAWTPEDTMRMHPDLIDDLSKLYDEEEAKTLTKLEASNTQAVKEAEAIEGK